jgi:hypothetical protein
MPTLYPMPNNTTVGLGGVLDYAKASLETVNPFIGGNFVGMLVLIPLWFIILFMLAVRFGPLGGFVVASFICMLVSVPLIALNYVSWLIFGLFMAFTAVGTVLYYLQSRS